MNNINIGLIDDHQIFREGVSSLVGNHAQINVLFSVESYESLDIALLNYLDVLVVDLNLETVNGLSIVKMIRPKFPKLKIIVLSMMSPDVYEKKALETGANIFISKSDAFESLVDAVLKLSVGDIENQSDNALIENSASKWDILIEELSSREKDVLKYILLGMTQKEISFELGINVKTISTYKRRLMTKLNVDSDVELVKLYSAVKS
jgi:DNA-binding NarL/FixJ family response regulator